MRQTFNTKEEFAEWVNQQTEDKSPGSYSLLQGFMIVDGQIMNVSSWEGGTPKLCKTGKCCLIRKEGKGKQQKWVIIETVNATCLADAECQLDELGIVKRSSLLSNYSVLRVVWEEDAIRLQTNLHLRNNPF